MGTARGQEAPRSTEGEGEAGSSRRTDCKGGEKHEGVLGGLRRRTVGL